MPTRVSIVLFVLWLEDMRAGVFKRNFRYFAAFLRNDILLRVQKLNTLYNYVMFQASEDWTNASVSRVNISFDKYLVSFFKYMVNHLIMKGNCIIDLFMISVTLNSTPSKNTDKYDETLPQAYIKIYSYKNWRSLKIIRRLKQIFSQDKS